VTAGSQGSLELVRGADASVEHGRVDVERRHVAAVLRPAVGPPVDAVGIRGGMLFH